MNKIKWIKICTDIFDDEKILLIENMPEADSIIVIWFKLLCMAGKQNNSGVFTLNEKMAYTEEMLATIFRRPLEVVKLALNTFSNFGMIEIIEGTVTIPNWEKHQSLDKYELAKEKTRQRVANYREKQRQKTYCNVTVTESNVDRIDKDIDKDIDNNILSTSDNADEPYKTVNFQNIVNSYNLICVSLPKVQRLTEARKKAIKSAMEFIGNEEDFKQFFEKVEASDFLCGRTEKAWTGCGLDWILKKSNTVKILEGYYDNRNTNEPKAKNSKPDFYDTSRYEDLNYN